MSKPDQPQLEATSHIIDTEPADKATLVPSEKTTDQKSQIPDYVDRSAAARRFLEEMQARTPTSGKREL